jgi:hypothetical protein
MSFLLPVFVSMYSQGWNGIVGSVIDGVIGPLLRLYDLIDLG